MASIALDPAYRRLSVEEFLTFDLGAPAELDDGLIYLNAPSNEAHARIVGNILIALRAQLRGSSYRCGSATAVRTGERTLRFPDVSIYRGDPATSGDEARHLLGEPVLVVEVMSSSTAGLDQRIKLPEYQSLPGTTDIVFVDPQAERIRHVRRTSPRGWADDWLDDGADLVLTSLGITLPHAEVFAHD